MPFGKSDGCGELCDLFVVRLDKCRAGVFFVEYDVDDYVFIPGIRAAIANGIEEIPAKVIAKDGVHDITLCCKGLTAEEKEILVEGCLMNYYASKLNK